MNMDNNESFGISDFTSLELQRTEKTYIEEEQNHPEEEVVEVLEDATWIDVCRACCIHSPRDWGFILIGFIGVLFFLYFFLVGLDLLSNGAKVVGGCTAGALFGDNTNPVAGLMVGLLATVLIQSSSSTTSIVVSLVGAGSITVHAGIYMIMGANIGTSVTNTIVALGFLGNGDELELAFSGATVHDMFNFLTVGILFPLELITNYLYYLSLAAVSGGDKHREASGSKWEGPLKTIVDPLINKIIIPNKSISKQIATGADCDDFYPVNCTDGIVDYVHCTKVGLIVCDKIGCPAFFQNGATRRDDEMSGTVCLILGLVILIICLIGLVTILQKMTMGVSNRLLHKATDVNGYVAILIGAGITVLVQSSSITTSTLTPFVGVGAIRLEQMYPLTLGANIGTTVTGLLASLVTVGTDALQVALCHLFFNISGIIIWYPIPFMRKIPMNAARALGSATRVWRGFPIVYILVVFAIFPLLLLGLSSLFVQGSKGFTVLGGFLTAALVLLIVFFLYKWYKGGLREKVFAGFRERERKRLTMATLPDDIEYLKNELATIPDDIESLKIELARLRDLTGLPDPTSEAEKEDV